MARSSQFAVKFDLGSCQSYYKSLLVNEVWLIMLAASILEQAMAFILLVSF